MSRHAGGRFFYREEIYFGGTLLGFAACLDHWAIVDYLLDNPYSVADVHARDVGPIRRGTSALPLKGIDKVIGNSVLHCLVYHDRASMYLHLVSKHDANTWAVNHEGETPLLLAARLGKSRMVELVLESTCQELWTFGPVSSRRYPLYMIERVTAISHVIAPHNFGPQSTSSAQMSRMPQSSNNPTEATPIPSHSSVRREYLLRRTLSPQGAPLLYIPLIWELLRDKWFSFGRAIYLWFMLLHTINILSLSLAVCSTFAPWISSANLTAGDESQSHHFGTASSERCEALVFVIFVPLRANIHPAVGDFTFVCTLLLTIYLLAHRLYINLRLRIHSKLDLISFALPWLAAPFRYSESTFAWHLYMLAASLCLTWFRFMQYWQRKRGVEPVGLNAPLPLPVPLFVTAILHSLFPALAPPVPAPQAEQPAPWHAH